MSPQNFEGGVPVVESVRSGSNVQKFITHVLEYYLRVTFRLTISRHNVCVTAPERLNYTRNIGTSEESKGRDDRAQVVWDVTGAGDRGSEVEARDTRSDS